MFMTKKQAQLLLLAAGVLMLLFGLWRGEADTVFSKAIRLCMECVGIGLEKIKSPCPVPGLFTGRSDPFNQHPPAQLC